ncbi:MAG: hypothetical protein ACI8ZO_000109 [Flavobacteriales bacterium]|jgi:hypothetical protein
MKKLGSIALGVLLTFQVSTSKADEGMWLPMFLGMNMEEMQAAGLNLTAEQLYDINNSSLKDAIVSLGGFCTAEMISSQGLMLTNHHCGYDAIQSHSTKENNILEKGFWAMSMEEEKPNAGLFARFLVRMEDVSTTILADVTADMSEEDRDAAIGAAIKTLTEDTKGDADYKVSIKSFFEGNEYYMFVYETFNDVRLVGNPPESVGKFGGDTDNWMWPRHTGDFSMFRVYMAPDGSPAEYAEDNIPYAPKHHLPVSLKGVNNGDFAMIMGYPGSTDRFLTSFGVQAELDIHQPSVVEIRDVKLSTMKTFMDQDPGVRLQYASKYAQTANYWKYYIGQQKQLKRNNVLEQKLALENEFTTWVNADATRKATYGEALTLIEEAYKMKRGALKGNTYVLEAGLIGADSPLFAYRASATLKAALASEDQEKIDAAVVRIAAMAEGHFKNFDADVDRNVMGNLFNLYAQNVAADQQPAFFAMVNKKFKGDFAAYADKVADKSIFTNKARLEAFLAKPRLKKLEADYLTIAASDLITMYRSGGNPEADEKMQKGNRLFVAGLREMNPDKKYAPNANSTMRLTYGNVGDYMAADAVHFDYITTIDGVMQKMDNSNPEFVVPERLAELYKTKDYGQYADENGNLPICFISNNDITGGNSGSPVINGDGELIGLAFDGNWEAMSGDIAFEHQLQRTISVDIRYVLFSIDKYAGCTRLIEEMDLVMPEMTAQEAELEMAE